ncbi:hypothetical protein GWK47_054589 [Chionoecetes opilio]|uniref:Uncharacterized protein n=1 Tax=Chionoecetes opilio TaxID=41210 RepID=A0A8J4XZU4_CHIOP|nr:hypothetical protein GWK47_054589 [Chionoecetes opilio]
MSPPPGSSFSGGRLRDAAATLQEVADGQPRGHRAGKEGTQQERCPCGYPMASPRTLYWSTRFFVSGVRCSYSAGLKRDLPTRQVQLTLQGHVPRRPGPWLLRDIRGAQVQTRNLSPLLPLPGVWALPAPVSAAAKSCVWVCSGDTLHGPASTSSGGWRAARGSVPQLRLPRHHAWNRRCPARLRQIPGSTVSSPAAVEGGSPASTSVCTPAPAPRMKTPPRPDGPARRRRKKRPRRVTLLSPCGGYGRGRPGPRVVAGPGPLRGSAIGGVLQPCCGPPP